MIRKDCKYLKDNGVCTILAIKTKDEFCERCMAYHLPTERIIMEDTDDIYNEED